MKHLKTLLLIAVLTLGFNSIQAQNKTAHINFQELITLMPETKVMGDELAKLDKTQQYDLKTAESTLKAKLTKYQAEAASQTPEENKKRQHEVQQDEQRLYSSAQAAQTSLGEKRNEKLKYKAYRWIELTYKTDSDAIKRNKKEFINKYFSHASPHHILDTWDYDGKNMKIFETRADKEELEEGEE